MTVKELMEILQKQDPNKIVCTVKGISENGIPDISEAKVVKDIVQNTGKYFHSRMEEVIVVI